jgi:hypothetical protein
MFHGHGTASETGGNILQQYGHFFGFELGTIGDNHLIGLFFRLAVQLALLFL